MTCGVLPPIVIGKGHLMIKSLLRDRETGSSNFSPRTGSSNAGKGVDQIRPSCLRRRPEPAQPGVPERFPEPERCCREQHRPSCKQRRWWHSKRRQRRSSSNRGSTTTHRRCRRRQRRRHRKRQRHRLRHRRRRHHRHRCRIHRTERRSWGRTGRHSSGRGSSGFAGRSNDRDDRGDGRLRFRW